MLGPEQLAYDLQLASDSDGTGDRVAYFEVPFAAHCEHLYFEAVIKNLTSDGRISFDLEHSVSGENWKSTGQSWSAMTGDGVEVLATSGTFATRARFVVTISGDSGAAQKLALLRLWASGKPF